MPKKFIAKFECTEQVVILDDNLTGVYAYVRKAFATRLEGREICIKYKDKDFVASEFELSRDDKTAATQLTEAVDNRLYVSAVGAVDGDVSMTSITDDLFAEVNGIIGGCNMQSSMVSEDSVNTSSFRVSKEGDGSNVVVDFTTDNNTGANKRALVLLDG